MKLNTDLTNTYYQWLIEGKLHASTIVFKKEEDKEKFMDILHLLFIRDFEVILDMDSSRAKDGCYLRDIFMTEYLKDDMITPHSNPWDEVKCSVLELMIALCIKMRDDFYSEYEEEHDVCQTLFIRMLQSLGIMTRGGFQSKTVINTIISTFIYRQFQDNGNGSLFNLKDKTDDEDWTHVPIWYQMMAYIRVSHPFEE